MDKKSLTILFLFLVMFFVACESGNSLDNKATVTEGVNEGRQDLSVEEVQRIVLEDSGLARENVKFTKTELEEEDSNHIEYLIYDIEFEEGKTEYEYEVNSKTGTILSKKVDGVDIDVFSYSTNITVEEAQDIALADASLKREDVKFSNSDLDKDNGILKYEIEFIHGNNEYEYEINASNGEIISKDIDR